MSSSLTDQLFEQLQGAPLQQIAQQLGAGQAQTAGAVSAALPLLMGALGRNASQPQGAQSLLGALQRDHLGSNDLSGLLGAVLGGSRQGQPSRQTDGAGILGHILGNRQSTAASSLGQATGLGADKAGQLMQMLAPLVMGFLARQMFQGGQSAPSAQTLGSLLGQEQQQVRQQGGLGGGLLGAVLDQDGDGKVDLGDLLKIGGSLFGKRR